MLYHYLILENWHEVGFVIGIGCGVVVFSETRATTTTNWVHWARPPLAILLYAIIFKRQEKEEKEEEYETKRQTDFLRSALWLNMRRTSAEQGR